MAMRFVLFLVLAIGCTPAKAPAPRDIAIGAVTAVDAALAVEIATSTADAGADVAFDRDVQLVEDAAAIVKAGASVCPLVPALRDVSSRLGCTQCAAALAAASEAYKCQ